MKRLALNRFSPQELGKQCTLLIWRKIGSRLGGRRCPNSPRGCLYRHDHYHNSAAKLGKPKTAMAGGQPAGRFTSLAGAVPLVRRRSEAELAQSYQLRRGIADNRRCFEGELFGYIQA